MNLVMPRCIYTPTSTIGHILIGGQLFCHTLEDVVRKRGMPKVYGETAIPSGRYQVKVTHSPKFGKMLPELVNVPNFSGIRMHGGNKVEDTLGCILVAERIIDNFTIQGSQSENLIELLLDHSNEDTFVEIIDTFPYYGIAA